MSSEILALQPRHVRRFCKRRRRVPPLRVPCRLARGFARIRRYPRRRRESSWNLPPPRSLFIPSLRSSIWFRRGERQKSPNGDSCRIRQFDQFCPVEKKRAPSVHRKRRRTCTPHLFDGGQTDHGYIKAHVLARFADFHDNQRLASRT